MTFESFTKLHGLEIDVRYYHPDRFVVSFKKAELKDGGCLVSAYGDANTWRKALKEYQERIKGGTLILNAYSESRSTIKVPNVWSKAK